MTKSTRTEHVAVRPARAIVGWREWVSFPDLGIGPIKAKIDTGARSSALHAVAVERFRRRGQSWVRFNVHPEQRSPVGSTICEALVHDERQVKSSNNQSETRLVIRADVRLAHSTWGSETWPIELTLASRADMGFRLLLGREAIRGRFLVDPGHSYLWGRRKRQRGTSP